MRAGWVEPMCVGNINAPSVMARLFLFLQICIPIMWGFLAMHLGQDINGDQLYYHYYGAMSVLRGRYLNDIAAGGMSGYNNPLMYFPFVIAVNHLSAATVSFIIGAWQGLNISLVLSISRQIIRPVNVWGILLCVAVVAYLLTTPVFILTVGRTFGDDWASVPFLAGVWFLLRAPENGRFNWIGGLLVGISAGLKITNIPIALAFGIALAFTYPHPRKLFSVAMAVLVGFVVAGGWWFAFNYNNFGNPLFPYYNGVFKSPWYPELNFRDTRWGAESFLGLVSLPFNMAKGTTTVIEANYQETHWLIFSFLFIFAAAYAMVNVIKIGVARVSRSTVLLALFCALAFLLWAYMLHYLRYLMVPELLLPLAVAMLLQFLGGSDRAAAIALASIVLVSASVDHYLPMSWSRISRTDAWYQVPELGIPAGSAVVLGNDVGFVAKVLPGDTTLIGLGTNYFFAGLPTDGGTPLVNKRIIDAMWRDPSKVYQLTLLSLPLKFDPVHVASQLGFTLDKQTCREVLTNLGALQVCQLSPVQRIPAPAILTPR